MRIKQGFFPRARARYEAERLPALPPPRPSSKALDVFRLLLVDAVDILPYRFFVAVRRWSYRLAGARIGRGACLYGRQIVAYPQRLDIGSRCLVNAGCIFENEATIEIGDRCYVGPRVKFFTTDHDAATMANLPRPIRVGADSWIGGGATLLPGCEIADRTIVAAGAVMLGRAYSAGLYAGVPGVRKRPTGRADL